MLALVVSVVLLAEPSAPPLVPIDSDVPAAPPLVKVGTPPLVKQPRQRRKVVLIAAGAAVFGLSFGTSAIVAGTSEGLKRFPGQMTQLFPLFIPFAGPFVTMFTGSRDGGTIGFLLLDGISQLSGAAMLIAGLALSDDQPVLAVPRVWLVPAVSPTFVGANFGLHF